MRNYRLAPLIWAEGLAVAATTGYLRIAADKHYFSDVLSGALIGSAVGFMVPYLFHPPSQEKKVSSWILGGTASSEGGQFQVLGRW